MLTIRDPIHGFIRADPLEAALIASRPMQRLRYVHQLGLTSLVFPGAEHTRFSHALGAMTLAGRVYDALAGNGDGLLPRGRQRRERRLVRAAALLHDVGHAPFSHSAEELFEEGLDHEAMTRRLLTGLPEMAAIFERHGGGEGGGEGGGGEPISPGDVAALLGGGEGDGDGPVGRLLAQIVSGDVDADKMDYLLRDSLYCGVRYGSYDLDRLLDTLEPLEDAESGGWGIGVEAGGVHAVEALVMARYYMFTQVYFNPTGKALELHLNEWLAEEGRRWPSDPEAFLAEDDVSVRGELRRSTHPHARAVVERRHFPLAFESEEHLRAADRAGFETVLDEVRGEFRRGDLLVSHSAKDPHHFERSRVLVRHPDGRLQPITEASHFIRHLSRIERFRVYAAPERCAEVRDAIRRRWQG